MKIDQEIINLYKHKSYDNLRFLLSILVQKDKKYNLIMQIVEIESGNFARSLQFVSNTYTSKYYEAYAYISIKKPKKAALVLHGILDNDHTLQQPFENGLDNFILDKSLDIVFELLASVYRHLGNSEKSLKFYKKSFAINKKNYKSFMQIFSDKNESLKLKRNLQCKSKSISEKHIPEELNISVPKDIGNLDYVVDLELEKSIDIPFFNNEFKENENFREIKNTIELDENFSKKRYLEGGNMTLSADEPSIKVKNEQENHLEGLKVSIHSFYEDLQDPEPNIEKYKFLCPGIGSYFLLEIAVIFSEQEKIDDSLKIFEFVRKREKIITNSMDVYSTILYRREERDKLALLCRDLVKYSYESNVTWSALGNYYSLLGNSAKSILCLKKSLSISTSYYTAALMGHEYYHKRDLQLAQKYFNLSLLLFTRNYNALVGLGLTYFSLNQPENGIFYLKKAIETSPKNLMIKYILIKYSLKFENFEEALRALEEVFNLKTCQKYSEGERINKIYEQVVATKKQLSEVEEMIIMKVITILIDIKQMEKADRLLCMVQKKTPNYYKIKNLIFFDTYKTQ